MQELFAFRRSLELAALNPGNISKEHYQTWIQRLESVHGSLNEWVKVILPAFSEESLPLAIASYLNQLKRQHQDFEFSIEMKDWQPQDSPYVNEAILSYFQGLKDDIGTPDGFKRMKLSFVQEEVDTCLQIDFQQDNPLLPEVYEKAHTLSQMMFILARINCQSCVKKNSLYVSFRWPN